MKLNKVLALALSGVMAVSMLAGCKGGSANGEQGNTEQPVVSTDAVKVMNDAQKDVVFANDETLEAALASVVDKVKVADISDAAYQATQFTSARNIYNELSPKVVNLSGTALSSTYGNSKLTAAKKTTNTVLFMVKSNGLSEEQALKMVADKMDTDSFIDSTDAYNAAYTGAVSIAKATASNEDNTYEAYLIVVSVTQTVTKGDETPKN